MRNLFTLIELIAVIVIIGILSSVVLPNISEFKKESTLTSISVNKTNLQKSIDLYHIKNNNLPSVGEISIEEPQPIDYELLYPDIIRETPKENLYSWVDYRGKVYIASIDAPTDVINEEGLVSWNRVGGARGYIVYEVNVFSNLGKVYNINKVSDIVTGTNFMGESDKVYLISAVDEYGFETAPSGVNYLGYDNYKRLQHAFSCKHLLELNPSYETDYYEVKDYKGRAITIYCDMDTDGGGWTRLHYKDGPNTVYPASNITFWDETMVGNMNFKEIAWSDNIDSLKSNNSWILRDVYEINTYHGISDLSKDTVIANLLNGKTPSGTDWSSSCDGGYISFRGILDTMGDWSSLYRGCNIRVNVGELINFRIGGRLDHEGEFIHTACNDYGRQHNQENSLLSKWDMDNTRVMWVR